MKEYILRVNYKVCDMWMMLILFVLVLNVLLYSFIFFSWRKDCKEIGKDHLAVSLHERIRVAFLCFTLPCILGLATRK